MDAFQESLRTMLEAYMRSCEKAYEDIRHSSKILFDPTDLNSSSYPLNIDYIPNGNNPQEWRIACQNFSNMLSEELHLRELGVTGSLEDCREQL
jgi:hypothetical protein